VKSPTPDLDALKAKGFVVKDGRAARPADRPTDRPRSPATTKPNHAADRFKSDTERAYARHLEELRLAGEIIAWHYEPDLIGLYESAEGKWTRWTPDFLIETLNGFEYHEVKPTFIRKIDRIGIAKMIQGAGILRKRGIPVFKITKVNDLWVKELQ
jgi:hypothetical protein